MFCIFSCLAESHGLVRKQSQNCQEPQIQSLHQSGLETGPPPQPESCHSAPRPLVVPMHDSSDESEDEVPTWMIACGSVVLVLLVLLLEVGIGCDACSSHCSSFR